MRLVEWEGSGMKYRFSPQAEQASSYAANERRTAARGKNMISFVDGMPAEASLPIEAIREAEAKTAIARRAGGSLLQGSDTTEYAPFREAIAMRMAARGMRTSAEQLLATAGTQQAVDLAARALTVPGDAVLVETATNPAALRTFAVNGLRTISVPSDDSGMELEQAERLIKLCRPAMMYVMPTYGIPTGRAWSLERRQGLLAIGRTHGIPIIEDDSYGETGHSESARHTTLYALAGGDGGVLYVSSFSATALPRLQLGWAAGDAALIAMMTDVMRLVESGAGLYEQRLLCGLLERFDLNAHIRKLASAYSDRVSHLIRLLSENGPAGLTWSVPQGGSGLWLRLPDGLDGEALLRGTLRKEVAFEPGAAFYADNPRRGSARLSVASITDDQLERGAKLFVEAIEEFTARS